MSQRRKNLFICFIGIDGSGKTTLAQRLVARLDAEKIPVKYVWGSTDMHLSKLLVAIAKATFLRGSSASENYMEYKKSVNRIFRNPFIAQCYKSLLLFEQFYQSIYKVRIPLLFGKTVVCDRYIYDTALGLSVDLDQSKERLVNEVRRLLKMFPKPDLVFLIDIAEETAFARKNDVYSIDYLKLRRQRYLAMSREFKMECLNGDNAIDTLEDCVVRAVGVGDK